MFCIDANCLSLLHVIVVKRNFYYITHTLLKLSDCRNVDISSKLSSELFSRNVKYILLLDYGTESKIYYS